MATATFKTEAGSAVALKLLPILGVVFIGFLVIGLALPVLPLHVHDRLRLSPFVVGLVTGSQFAASLVARVWSGRAADMHGAKRAVAMGLAAASIAGLLYLLSTAFVRTPPLSATVLLVGRAVLGGAESFIITGATAWGLARVGTPHAGKVIAWMGTAMFAAFATGAPLGTALYDRAASRPCPWRRRLRRWSRSSSSSPSGASRQRTRAAPASCQLLGGSGCRALAALSSIGFGALLTFSALLFSTRHWEPVWLAFTAYAVALIATRLLFGHLPDRHGGAKVALFCVVIEAVGLGLIGLAPNVLSAATGSALTGFGYVLVFPGFGVEAVRRTPPESRGVAMGAYTACLDLALGIAGPTLGLVAGAAGLGSVFLLSAVVVLSSAAIALRLLSSAQQPAAAQAAFADDGPARRTHRFP